MPWPRPANRHTDSLPESLLGRHAPVPPYDPYRRLSSIPSSPSALQRNHRAAALVRSCPVSKRTTACASQGQPVLAI